MIAMSSILSFDIYGRYLNKAPTNEQLIKWSHIGVVCTSLGISTVVLAFHYGNVNMTWLLYAFGNINSPGVFPTVFSLLWKRQTKAAAIISPLVGMTCGLSVWFGTAYAYYGEVTIASTGSTLPCLFGVVTAFFTPLPVTVFISMAFPTEPFNFGIFGKISRVTADHTPTIPEVNGEEQWFTPERMQYMKKMSRWAAFWSIITLIGHVLLWPLPMYGAKMVFSKQVSSHECFPNSSLPTE
jgi:Na+/proline symporter